MSLQRYCDLTVSLSISGEKAYYKNNLSLINTVKMVGLVLLWVFIGCPCSFLLSMTTGEKTVEVL